MQLILSDNSTFNITIKENRVWDQLKRGYKHLQHVPIQFYPWDNKRQVDRTDRKTLVNDLQVYANKLNISIDTEKCLQGNQDYLNNLHMEYEKGYDGDRRWLEFHEHIHMLEISTRQSKTKNSILDLRWREKAGPLERDFNHDLTSNSVTSVKAGTVYSSWKELGKKPWAYWGDKESSDIDRILELCKPYTKLRLDFHIAFEDIDFLEDRRVEEFNAWWGQFEQAFCQHYNLPHWNLTDMQGVYPFGTLEQINELDMKLQTGAIPYKIKL